MKSEDVMPMLTEKIGLLELVEQQAERDFKGID